MSSILMSIEFLLRIERLLANFTSVLTPRILIHFGPLNF